MQIKDIMKQKKTLSFEIFPPKQQQGDLSSIYHTIEELAYLKPDFISVTYGAGGSTIGKTIEIASAIKRDYAIESVAHLTCVTSSEAEVTSFCEQLQEQGVDNILALRGDRPLDSKEPSASPFVYAKDLTTFIHEAFPNQFCISGACYPEVHQEAVCFEDDLAALKEKVDAGATYLITQIFFDNNYYYRLVKEARKIGITVPIIAGVMPALNAQQLLRTANLCGCTIPYSLATEIQKFYRNPAAMQEVGVHYAIHQILDLIANGVDGIHIYTMNRPEIAKSIFSQIPSVLEEFRKHG